MSFVFTWAAAAMEDGAFPGFASMDVRAALLKPKASTSVDTEQDVDFLADFTTLGELVCTGYARQPLAGLTDTRDDANNRGKFSADDTAFGNLGGAVNDTIGAILLYQHVSNDADSRPLIYADNGGADFSILTNGSPVTITWNVLGIVLVAA